MCRKDSFSGIMCWFHVATILFKAEQTWKKLPGDTAGPAPAPLDRCLSLAWVPVVVGKCSCISESQGDMVARNRPLCPTPWTAASI